MNAPLHPEVSILNEALHLPPEPRAAYLDQACAGDPALRRAVEDLLRAHEQAGEFLETSIETRRVARAIPANVVLTEKPGDRIDRYKLLEPIGQGGCGVVYLAEQEEPVRRRVALKVIKLGMDTKHVIARFDAERQALALMDHPNIAKVLDAGATQTGRPYFVMELVQGIKVTEFCEVERLSVRERLCLFIQICQAIQHAHQKGVIHRDIKPSNILVTRHDGRPFPKVIDFGIAKAIPQLRDRLTEQTLCTAIEHFIGTPAYMSPEQAAMTGVDVDTRSDVYSLGVLLYELLTGHTPFDQKELLAAGLEEMCRTIREKDPPKPSTRLTQKLEAARATNSLRIKGGDLNRAEENSASAPQALPGKELIPTLRGDLDWIVMKCLEKDRTRRYETANGLATDISRHLKNEPVTARPPNSLYRLRKALLRNKTAFAAAAMVAVVLVIAVIISTTQAFRARRAEHVQIQLGREAQTANLHLRDTVRSLELQRAEGFFRNGDAGTAVAHLAAMLRRDPSNNVAASRLVSALVHRNWALPTTFALHHTGRVETLCFSPSGRHVLSASRDATARIWDAFSGQSIAVLTHAGRVYAASYNASGTHIVTACEDGTAQIWDATSGQPHGSPLRHKGRVYWAEFSRDEHWVVTASADRAARIWDAKTGALKHELRKHTSHVILARFSPDSRRLATGGSHASIRIWSVDSGEMLFHVEDRKSPLTAMAFSPNGTRLLSLCQDGRVRLWNLETQAEIPLPQENEPVEDAVFSPDSRFLLTCSHDSMARIWDTDTGLQIGSPLVHDGLVISGQFSSDGQTIATLSREHAARLWDLRSRLPLCQPIRVPEEFTLVSISPDRKRLVTAGREGTLHVWDIRPRRFDGFESGFQSGITSVEFSPDGKSLLAVAGEGTMRILNARSGQVLSQMHNPSELYLATFAPDGNRVFTATSIGEVRIWDWRKEPVIAGPFQHPAKIRTVRFDSSGDRVVTSSEDGTVRVWQASTWQPLSPPLPHPGVIMASLSPDGRMVVSAGEDRTARVWNATNGEAVVPPLEHKDHVKWAEFSPDDKSILTASTDNTACVWDLLTGQRKTPSFQHARIVEKAAFDFDGQRVITASIDRTARIWDIRTGSALTPPMKHDYALIAAAFSRSGELAMTGCWNGAVRAWDAKSGQPTTEPLGGNGWISRMVALEPTSGGLAAGGLDSTVRLWHVPSIPVPVPSWFLTVAETVAGIRLGDRGQLELVPKPEFVAAMEDLQSRDAQEFYGHLARWFLAEPGEREPSPY